MEGDVTGPREAEVEAVAEAIRAAFYRPPADPHAMFEGLARAAIAALPDRFEEGRRAGLAEARERIEAEKGKWDDRMGEQGPDSVWDRKACFQRSVALDDARDALVAALASTEEGGTA